MKTILIVLLWLAQYGHASTLSVIDNTGSNLLLNHPVERILSLSPHAAELVLAAGAADKLVGVATFNDYPDQLKHLPQISSFGGLDREQVILLDPDLVIAWSSGNKATDIQWLKSIGIPVYLSEPVQLTQIADSIEHIGILANTHFIANKAAQDFRLALASACSRRSEQTLKNTYYEIWPQPPMTIGGQHWLNEILEIAGLKNAFSHLPRQIFSVEPEALMQQNVEITISEYGASSSRYASGRRIGGNPLLSRPGPNIIEGIRQLCIAL